MLHGKISIQPEQLLHRTAVVWILALFCCALWGSAFPCIKIGYRLMQIDSGDSAAQILYAGVRFTIAGILTLIAGRFIKRSVLIPKITSFSKIIVLAMTQTVLQYVFFYIGLAHVSGVNASIIEAANVFAAIFFSSVVFRIETMNLRKFIGCLIGFSGVLLVTLSGGRIGELSWNGEGFILLSTLAYAFAYARLKVYSRTEDTVLLSGFQFILGGVIMMFLGIMLGGKFGNFDVKALLMLLWLSFVSSAAYTIWGLLLKYNDVSRVAVFGFSNPVFGVLLSAVLLDEGSRIGPEAIGALFLVCVGIYICHSRKKMSGQQLRVYQYDPERQYAVIRSSICSGERVAGFKNYDDSHFTEIMLIKSDEDLERFCTLYGVGELKTEY